MLRNEYMGWSHAPDSSKIRAHFRSFSNIGISDELEDAVVEHLYQAQATASEILQGTAQRSDLVKYENETILLRERLAESDAAVPIHGYPRLPIEDPCAVYYQGHRTHNSRPYQIGVMHGLEPTLSQWACARLCAQKGLAPIIRMHGGHNSSFIALQKESEIYHYVTERLNFATLDDVMHALGRAFGASPDPARRVVILDATPVWRMPTEMIKQMAEDVRTKHFSDSIFAVHILRDGEIV